MYVTCYLNHLSFAAAPMVPPRLWVHGINYQRTPSSPFGASAFSTQYRAEQNESQAGTNHTTLIDYGFSDAFACPDVTFGLSQRVRKSPPRGLGSQFDTSERGALPVVAHLARSEPTLAVSQRLATSH